MIITKIGDRCRRSVLKIPRKNRNLNNFKETIRPPTDDSKTRATPEAKQKVKLQKAFKSLTQFSSGAHLTHMMSIFM